MSFLRENVMRDKFTIHIGLHLFNDDKMLLLKNLNGTWGILGGHLEFEENIEESLKREVLEETGIKIRNFEMYRYFVKQDNFVILFFGETTTQEVTLSGEHMDYKWTDLAYIDEFTLEHPEIKEDSIYLYSERLNKEV